MVSVVDTIGFTCYTYPTLITCSLTSPEIISGNHNVETKALNFWSGNREVYAIGRTSKRTILSGKIWDYCVDGVSQCSLIINCIRNLAKTAASVQLPVLINGLYYTELNTFYNIISFDWTHIQELPLNVYEWKIELEFID